MPNGRLGKVTHLKGTRFNCPVIERVCFVSDKGPRRINWHAHPGYEVHYMLKGKSTWELDDCSKSLTLSGGWFFIFPPNKLHHASNEIGTPSTRISVCYGPPSTSAKNGDISTPDNYRRFFQRFESYAFVPHRLTTRIKRLLIDLRDGLANYHLNSEDDNLSLRLLHELLLLETYRVLGRGNATLNNAVIPQILTWMSEHLSDEFSIDTLVNLSGYSRSQFYNLFLKETGMTPYDYLVRIRIDHAQKLISDNTDTPLSAVAAKCGFTSPNYFSGTFRKYVGMSPREFRKYHLRA